MGYGKKFLEKRFKYVMAGQAEKIVEEQYHDGAVIMAFPQIFSGKAAIFQAFSAFVKDRVKSIDLLELVETQDQIFCRARILRESGILLAQEAMYLVDGRVFRQFSQEHPGDEHPGDEKSMGMNTREVVEQYFKTVNAGDWAGWLELFSRDIVFSEPMGGLTGIDNLARAAQGLKTGYQTFENKLLAIFVDKDRAVACTQIRGVTMGGAPIKVKAANFYTVRNNKIVHQENLFDARQLKPFLDQNL